MRALLVATLLLAACTDPHFCASDVECKGNRICVRSVCEDPGATDGFIHISNACECNSTLDCRQGDYWACHDHVCRQFVYVDRTLDGFVLPADAGCPAESCRRWRDFLDAGCTP
jgi:hypothetical protein